MLFRSNAVSLTLTGQPSGSTVNYPTSATTSSTLTITVPTSASRQTYNLTITGSGGGIQRTTTAKLTVTR